LKSQKSCRLPIDHPVKRVYSNAAVALNERLCSLTFRGLADVKINMQTTKRKARQLTVRR